MEDASHLKIMVKAQIIARHVCSRDDKARAAESRDIFWLILPKTSLIDGAATLKALPSCTTSIKCYPARVHGFSSALWAP